MADYAISNVVRRVVYTNTGVGPYAFTFEVLANTDIAVYRGSTLLTLTTDYTVIINANGTGSVTLVVAGTGNITIVGARAIQRTSDYTTGGDLFASTLNTDLDSQTIYAQQVAETAERGLKAPVIDPTDINMTLPAKASRVGTVLAFNATTGNPEAGPSIASVTTVAAQSANINTVATNIASVNTVAGNVANVNTVAGVSGNVTTVASNITNVNAVGADLLEAVSEINTVATDIANVNTVGTNIANVNTVAGISANVTTVAGISANVTTVAGNNANVSTVAGISGNVTTVAGISANVTTVAGISGDVSTVATNNANVTTVATNIASVNTNATNIVAIQNASTNATNAANSATAAAASAASAAASFDAFDDIYLGAKASNPTVDNDGDPLTTGDQYFNTASNELRVWNGSSWQSASVIGGTVTTLGVTGVATFSAGTVSLPSITTTGDTNTGIFFPTADTIAFTEGGVESMRINSSGNVGIGTSSPTTQRLHISAASVSGPTNNPAGIRITDTGTSEDIQLVNRSGNMLYNIATGNSYSWQINSSEVATIDSSGNVGIGTSSPTTKLDVSGQARFSSGATASAAVLTSTNAGGTALNIQNSGTVNSLLGGYNSIVGSGNATDVMLSATQGVLAFGTGASSTERMRVSSLGEFLVGKTAADVAVSGFQAEPTGTTAITRASAVCLIVNRNTDDGTLISLRQANAEEGNISVSGTTVSYNGGHLSRWSQLPDGSKDNTILKGTVLTNLDDMCVWEKDGVVAENEQLNKMKVSDVEGDTNVAGVFVNWTIDEQYGVDDMNVAMTGDMIIRIAEGVVVQKGDLLMSAGDGTAKPQGDDIVRSKTIAKVTSNHVTCTYADGSYCVPCVLMAC